MECLVIEKGREKVLPKSVVMLHFSCLSKSSEIHFICDEKYIEMIPIRIKHANAEKKNPCFLLSNNE